MKLKLYGNDKAKQIALLDEMNKLVSTQLDGWEVRAEEIDHEMTALFMN